MNSDSQSKSIITKLSIMMFLQFFIWGVLIFAILTVASTIFGVDILEMQSAGISSEQMESIKDSATGDKSMLIIQEILQLPILKMFVLFIFYFLGYFSVLIIYLNEYATIF